MRVIEANAEAVLNIGYAGENERTRVHFAFDDLAEEFPGGTVVLQVKRPDEDTKYDVQLTVSGTDAYWLVTDYDLAYRGLGECQLKYSNGSPVAKRKIWKTNIDRSIEGSNATIPPTWEDIENELLEAAGELHAELESYNAITAEATTLPEGSSATAEMDRGGDNPVLQLGIPKGDTGATPDFSIGTVQTGAAGSSASAEITGTPEAPVLNLTIPRGDKGETGDTGATPDITIGEVTTGEPGSSASATMTGTAENPVLSMSIPRGDKGETGDTGNGIASITKTGTSGLVDTYTILMTNGNSTTFTVTNGEDGTDGVGIQSVAKTGTSSNVDTYTITFTDGTTTTFTVTNGNAVIDDTAGAGDTTKVWSADKSASAVTALNNEISELKPTATNTDIGKALILKTIDQSGNPTAFEYGEAGGGTDVGLSVVDGKICVTYEEASA